MAGSTNQLRKLPDISMLKKRDVLCFGAIDNLPIEWRVLRVEEGRVLLVTRRAIASMPYHRLRRPVEWAQSSLRAWLNGEFVERSFDDEERSMIVKARLCNDVGHFGEAGGAPTEDWAFLLSADQVNELFDASLAMESLYSVRLHDRMCEAAYKARRKEVLIDPQTGTCCWWLRGPGRDATHAACVNAHGYIGRRGLRVDCPDGAVRPAIWIGSRKRQEN